MKKITTLLTTAIAVCGLLFSGCNNAEYDVLDNSVYIVDAAQSQMREKTVVMKTAGVDITVAVRLAKAVDYDVEVGIKIDPSILTAYNAQHNTEYISVPSQYIQLPDNASVTIKANEIAGILTVHIDNFTTNNQPYCLPVALNGVKNADVPQSSSLDYFLYLIDQPLITAAPHITGSHSCSIAGDWGISCAAWTMEFWARMDDLTTGNQCILEFYNGAINADYVYIVWGDARTPKNIFRVKIGNNELYTAGILETQRWYHYAIVNDGANVIVYLDGQYCDVIGPFGGPKVLAKPGGMWGTLKNAYFCQYRIWKTARTQAEIQTNMRREVDPTDPNLVVYWKANEGSGDLIHDVTGNERHMTIINATLEWLPEVVFD
ncbi:MAG: DUF1735 and LamG domain-containing protein [Prevotellaceae bacterium]|nr:DUF1735 and LamG domain-containing protein [Prevotellaceae bacterium]